MNEYARRTVLASLLSIALLVTALPASAQPLLVPMTGSRLREIQPESLFQTLFRDFFLEDDRTTYVQTGDIPAMWLRDSSAQTIPYIPFQLGFPILRARFAGVIERNARNVLSDPYANAFSADYRTWERKWEIDSLAFPVLLAWIYWQETGDRTIFTQHLHDALTTTVRVYLCEERHAACRGSYRFDQHEPTDDRYNPNTGMIWGAFRPSDDPVQYRFNVPQNMLAVVALRALAALAREGWGDAALADRASELAARVQTGIERYGRFFNPQRRVWMYAFETDGYNAYNLMDDANIPNLTTTPYINWSSAEDPTYLATRDFALSADNPWYFSGRYATGLGSPHTPYGYVWPLGIIGRALTATSSTEVAESITTLAQTDTENGMIHESFYPDGYWRYTRPEFGWANALYAELLFRAVAGFPATPFVRGGTILPFQVRSETPTLVPLWTQIQNTGGLYAALGGLLRTGGNALPSP
ncbi:MAG: glycoside hydrolase family 125 protein [Vulcanimicrobiaceae bacterium]